MKIEIIFKIYRNNFSFYHRNNAFDSNADLVSIKFELCQSVCFYNLFLCSESILREEKMHVKLII